VLFTFDGEQSQEQRITEDQPESPASS